MPDAGSTAEADTDSSGAEVGVFEGVDVAVGAFDAQSVDLSAKWLRIDTSEHSCDLYLVCEPKQRRSNSKPVVYLVPEGASATSLIEFKLIMTHKIMPAPILRSRDSGCEELD